MARTVASVTPPDASSRTPGADGVAPPDGFTHQSAVMLSRSTMSGRAGQGFVQLGQRLHLDFERARPDRAGAACGLDRGADLLAALAQGGR